MPVVVFIVHPIPPTKKKAGTPAPLTGCWDSVCGEALESEKGLDHKPEPKTPSVDYLVAKMVVTN